MNSVYFIGGKPIRIIAWLDTFVAGCTADSIPEGGAVELSQYFLDWDAYKTYVAGLIAVDGVT